MNAMELDPNSAIETKGKRLVPRWLAISAVVISTLSLLICALALLWVADSEEKELEKLHNICEVHALEVAQNAADISASYKGLMTYWCSES